MNLFRLFFLAITALFALSSRPVFADDCAPQQGVVAELQQVVKVTPPPAAETQEDLKDLEALVALPKLADVPKTLSFPSSFIVGSRYAWDNSLPSGRSQEQGGILVKQPDGEYLFRRGGAGASAMWTPNYGDKKQGESIIALLHTHPYDKTEGNFTHVSFSGQDIALLVFSEESISVVQSGPGMFAIARSKEFSDWISKYSSSQRDRVYNEIVAYYNMSLERAMNQGKGFKEAIDEAVKAVAAKYKLAYYAGEAGWPLKRVETGTP